MPEYQEKQPTRFFENKEIPLIKPYEAEEIAEQDFIDRNETVQATRQKLADLKLAKSYTGIESLASEIGEASCAVVLAEEAARLTYQQQKKAA